MWDNTEPEDARDSAGFADPLTDFIKALDIGAALGAIGRRAGGRHLRAGLVGLTWASM